MRRFLKNKNFDKFLSTSYIIKSIFKDILSFILNNFHWLCYLIMILNHIMSYSLISLFYPISIFCYAIMEYPRPKKFYWSLCFIYTIVCLIIKFMIQSNVWKLIPNYEKKMKYLEYYRIGFEIFGDTFSKQFFSYILFDALVLIFLLINDYLLVSKGLFDKREQEIETIYQANERIVKNKNLKFNSIEDINDYLMKEERKFDIDEETEIKEEKKEEKLIGLLDRITESKNENEESNDKIEEPEENKIDKNKKEKKENKKGFLGRLKKEKKKKVKNIFNESKKGYYESLFPKLRNEKPGKEFYVSYTISMTFIIIYIFLFYTTMIKDKTFGSVSIETTQFSGEMVLFLLLHIFFLVADRIIYIKQNRKNLKYQYILYDNISNKIIKNLEEIGIIKDYPLFKKEEIIIPHDYENKLNKNYSIIYIQIETFNTPLFFKYLMHMIIVIFAHILIFFYMPMYGNYKLNSSVYCKEESKECNDFLKNISLPIFYIFYLVYFISSGLQVKYGFYDMKRKSVLKAKNNTIYGGIYAVYKNIPFLYELKLGIDWTFTTTCLDLFQWNKFEGVYDICFTTNCSMTAINKKKVGQAVGKGSKIGMGGVLSFVLILVLFGPLLLFSTLNPTNELNDLTNADLTVELGFIYKNELMKNYTLYQNLKPLLIEPISSQDFSYYNYTKCAETKNFPIEQIQTV